MLSLTAFADELEREKARQRTADAMLRKARAGHVTGGRVFGYQNVEVCGADGRRSHVTRAIDPVEADVVRDIFGRCARGRGVKGIAKALNEAGVRAPRAQQARPTGWAPSSVRDVLYRDLYRGRIVYNRTAKRNQWGQRQQHDRPEAQWIEVEAPALQIVSDELWTAAHDRLASTRGIYLRGTNGRLWGRPTSGLESRYLLTGLARCGTCGGTLTVRSRQHGKRRVYFYACSSFHHRGRAVCPNSLEMPLHRADEAVLEMLERELLTEVVIEPALDRAAARLTRTPADAEGRRSALSQDVRRLEEELAHLTAAIAEGGQLDSLVAGIRARERQLATARESLKQSVGQRGPFRPVPSGRSSPRSSRSRGRCFDPTRRSRVRCSAS